MSNKLFGKMMSSPHAKASPKTHAEVQQEATYFAADESKKVIALVLDQLDSDKQPHKYKPLKKWIHKEMRILENLVNRIKVRKVRSHSFDLELEEAEDAFETILMELTQDFDTIEVDKQDKFQYSNRLEETEEKVHDLNKQVSDMQKALIECEKTNHMLECKLHKSKRKGLREVLNQGNAKTVGETMKVATKRYNKFDKIANKKVHLLENQIKALQEKLKQKNQIIRGTEKLKKTVKEQQGMIKQLKEQLGATDVDTSPVGC